ncbi:ABC transporter substrate-binding protein [Dactylosporangium sp. CA-092794]|uniref:ABC transporter substrate-binding protein n=1 Tax=Dactylosporangium sp. CA-092794 TaxID=3239929 RepID=UPI003D8DEBD4
MSSRFIRRRTVLGMMAAPAAALTLGACGGSDSDGSPGKPPKGKVSVAFGLTLGNSSNPFAWIGKYLGYFDEENIDPDVISLNGDSARGSAMLTTGQLDVGIFGLEQVLRTAADGRPIKARAVYNVQSRSQYEGVVVSNSPVNQLTDLKGKKIGIPQLDGTLQTYVNATLASGGLSDPGISFLATGVGVPMGEALKKGQVDAAFATRGQLGTLLSGGYNLRFLPRPAFAENFITGNIVARSDLSADKVQALKGYLRAYTKAIVFSKANPQAAMLINWKMYPDAVPKNVPVEQALAAAVDVYKAYLDYITVRDGKWGYMPPDLMENYVDFLGLKGKVDVKQWYTNDYIDFVNDFDQQAITDQAKNYKAPSP